MNVSLNSSHFTMVQHRDTFNGAVTKNVMAVALCISINYINGLMVHTFHKHQVLHGNPRYILFMHLVVNDMLLLFLMSLLYVLSYILFTLNVGFCICVILVAICTNTNTPLNLAVMAVECYIAICFPLRCGQICTVKKTYLVIGLIWVVSGLSVLPDLFVTLGTEPLGFFHSRVFCLRDTVFRNPYLREKRDASFIIFLVLVWLILFYTYFNILFAAKAASVDAKKARNTVVLHGFQLLLSMLTYVGPLVSQGFIQLLPDGVIAVRFSLFILIQILPRLISPVIYGLRDRTFRKLLLKDLLGSSTGKALATKPNSK